MPATKTKQSPEDFHFQGACDRLLLLSQAFTQAQEPEDLAEIIRVSGVADSIGPIFHPSEWMKSTGDHKRVAELARRTKSLCSWFKENFPEACDAN